MTATIGMKPNIDTSSSSKETILKQSNSAYSQKLVLAVFLAAWGASSILYCVASFEGHISSWLTSRAFAIPLTIGLAANFLFALDVWFLVFPLKVTLNQFGITYENAGFKKHMSWNDVIEISSHDMPNGRYRSDGKIVVIKGAEAFIQIPPLLRISQQELIELLSSFSGIASKDNFSRDYGNDANDRPNLVMRRVDNYKTRRIYTFLLIIVVAFFTATMFLIWWSLRLVHSAS